MRFTSNAVWLTGCRAGGDLLNLMLFVIVSRHFGPAGVGAYSYGFAVATFVFVIGCLGIEEYGLRQYARIDPARQRSFLAELLGAQLLMIGVAVGGLLVYLWLTAPTRATLLIVVLFTIFQASVALARTLFIPAMSQQHMVHPAIADLAARAMAFGVAGAAVALGHLSLAPSLVGFPVSSVILLGIGVRSAARHGVPVRVVISRDTLRAIVAVLWSFALIEVFAQLLTRIGVISLTLQAGDAAAGEFATGLKLVEVSLMPLAFLGVAAYPRLSQLYATDRAAFQRGGTQLMWLMVLVSGGSAWGLSFIAPVLLVPVLGARFAGMESVIATMALLAAVQGFEATLGRLLYCSDCQVRRAAVIVTGAVLNTTLCLLIVPAAGVRGAIFAAAASYAAIDLAYVLILRRSLTTRRLLHIFLPFMGGAAAGVSTAILFASAGFPLWIRALAVAVAFLCVLRVSYAYSIARSDLQPAAAPPRRS